MDEGLTTHHVASVGIKPLPQTALLNVRNLGITRCGATAAAAVLEEPKHRAAAAKARLPGPPQG